MNPAIAVVLMVGLTGVMAAPVFLLSKDLGCIDFRPENYTVRQATECPGSTPTENRSEAPPSPISPLPPSPTPTPEPEPREDPPVSNGTCYTFLEGTAMECRSNVLRPVDDAENVTEILL